MGQQWRKLTVKDLADRSGVSVRTLHYYDQIDLLKPAETGANGYRYYDRDNLLRLQQILFYRQLHMPLTKIRAVLDDPAFNVAEALAAHRARLVEQLAEHQVLIDTIDKTLQQIESDEEMSNNPFKGFSPEKQEAYEQELIDQYGDSARGHILESKARVGKLSDAEMEAIKQEGHQVNLELVALIEAERSPEDVEVQKLIARHHAWVSHFWTPNQAAYIGLGQNYVSHPDFKAFYDKYDTRLVAFLADAMKVYAETNLD